MRDQKPWTTKKNFIKKPWRNRRIVEKLLCVNQIGNLLSPNSVDIIAGFNSCTIGSVDDQVRSILNKNNQTNETKHVHNPFMINPIQPHTTEITSKPVVEFYVQPDFKFDMLKPFELFIHQVESIKWAKYREENPLSGIRGGIISLEMGLGKTLTLLSLIQSENFAPNLFVCNKSLIGSISADCKKFFGDTLPFFVLHNDYMKNLDMNDLVQGWFQNVKFILTTYDVLVVLAKKAETLPSTQLTAKKKQAGLNFFNIKFHRIICDESQRFANPKSQIFRTLMKLKGNFRWCLTGTPIKNYSGDLHTQLLFCGLNRNIKWTKSMYLKLGLRQAVHCVSMEEANIQLPKKTSVQIDLDFSEAERNIYQQVHQSAALTYSEYSKGTMKYGDMLAQIMRLRQVSIAPFLVSDKTQMKLDKTQYGICATKILRSVQIVKEVPENEKVLIFSSFTSVLDLVRNSLKMHLNLDKESVFYVDGTTPKRDDIFNKFRDNPSSKVLLMTTRIGSMGLNLTQANHVILMEPWWNDKEGDQAAHRCWRIGQTKEVYIWNLIMKDSIEQRMLEVCQTKVDDGDLYLTKNNIDKEMLLNLFTS